MQKIWNLCSRFCGLLILIILPMNGICYYNTITNVKVNFSVFEILFGNKNYGISFNIIIFASLLLVILTGFIELIFKDKVKAYLVTIFAYVIDIIILIFTKKYFFLINKSYKFINLQEFNSIGYGYLIACIICMIGVYFAYMSLVYAYDDAKQVKKSIK